MKNEIKKILAREILDSRGNPTIEAEVFLQSGISAKASVPSGASTGTHEALELRDNDKKRFNGKGVLKAVKNVNLIINKELKGINVKNQKQIDLILIELAGENKKKLGGNATLAVSLACARAGAMVSEMELYKYLKKTYNLQPTTYNLIPMFNIFNGGAHADNGLDIQEFMIVPLGNKSFAEKYRMGSEIFHSLEKILKDKKLGTGLGDEGGYEAKVNSALNVFDYLMQAIKKAGYIPGKQVGIALDVGASELYDLKKKRYNFKLENMSLRANEVVTLYKNLVKKYTIISIEDGLAEDDWDNWAVLNNELGRKIMIVGDDLTTTNSKRLEKVIEENLANAVIVKPNQIGTLTETIEFVKMAQKNGYKIITSHRSGETCDDFIADLAIAVNADFVKFGAPSRGERVCKYNRIAEIVISD